MVRYLFVLLFAFSAAASDVQVFAAASMSDALTEIAATYDKASRDRIRFNFAASSTLSRQISEGAPADLFISADAAQMNTLQSRGLIVRETLRSIGSNRLVIVIPRGARAVAPRDLASKSIRSIALADPRLVPAGVYAQAWLQRIQMWEAVRAKVIPTDNVRAALAAVEAGNVDAAIVYRSDARISRSTRVAYEIPAGQTPSISYPAAVVRGAANASGARRFLEYLSARPAREILVRHGFVIP